MNIFQASELGKISTCTLPLPEQKRIQDRLKLEKLQKLQKVSK